MTGWNLNETYSFIDPDTGLPAGKMDSQMAGDGTTELATEHDTEPKTFSSKFGGQSYRLLPLWRVRRRLKLLTMSWMR